MMVWWITAVPTFSSRAYIYIMGHMQERTINNDYPWICIKSRGHAKLGSDWSIIIIMAACTCDHNHQLSNARIWLVSAIVYLIQQVLHSCRKLVMLTVPELRSHWCMVTPQGRPKFNRPFSSFASWGLSLIFLESVWSFKPN